VADPAVVNASPLILLTAASLTDLLQLAGDPLLIPRVVIDEIDAYGPTDATAILVRQTKWLTIVDPPPVPAIIERWDLGPGESSVLTWAHAHPGTIAVLDDLPARRCADSLRIPTRGTLGLVLIAKRRAIISQARPIVERLRQAGMYLSDDVMNRALSMIGE
jgi:predicted nucleic acid-binding protein